MPNNSCFIFQSVTFCLFSCILYIYWNLNKISEWVSARQQQSEVLFKLLLDKPNEICVIICLLDVDAGWFYPEQVWLQGGADCFQFQSWRFNRWMFMCVSVLWQLGKTLNLEFSGWAVCITATATGLCVNVDDQIKVSNKGEIYYHFMFILYSQVHISAQAKLNRTSCACSGSTVRTAATPGPLGLDHTYTHLPAASCCISLDWSVYLAPLQRPLSFRANVNCVLSVCARAFSK